MFQISIDTLKEGPWHRLAAGALTAALLAPAPASGFFQQTTLEGSLGTDLGGVWLSLHHMMPEFRITYQKPKAGPALPLEFSPIPDSLARLTGPDPEGVLIAKCTDAAFCAGNGILEGDILLKVGPTQIKGMESLERAVPDKAQVVALAMRRPALKMTTARLVKIRYKADAREEGGVTVADEDVDVRFLDVDLPFADAIEQSRRDHELIDVSAGDQEKLAEGWFELPGRTPPRYLSGKHRLVARADFDASLAIDPALSRSGHALVADLTANPMRGGGSKVVDLYGIEKMDAKRLEGNYVTVTIANAPFPVNIEFKGRFEMTRIADWSDRDDKLRTERAAQKKPAEDYDKFETLPDVPKPAADGEKQE